MIMMHAAHAPVCPQPGPTDGLTLVDTVEAIGGDGFPHRLLAFCDGLVGADRCAIVMLINSRLEEVGAAALVPRLPQPLSNGSPYELKRQLAQAAPWGARVDISELAQAGAGVSEAGPAGSGQRIMISIRKANTVYGIQLLRAGHRERLDEHAVERLRAVSDLLLSIAGKHVGLAMQKSNLTPALRLLPDIQNCILERTVLSRREGEVCARILYGLTSCGIALDLGIGKESVMTYRKRAYQRLGIGSQRELLMWYLALWSAAERREEDRGAGDELDGGGRVAPSRSVECGALHA
jgi:DNA-binding CsgD family transcriptional regulator